MQRFHCPEIFESLRTLLKTVIDASNSELAEIDVELLRKQPGTIADFLNGANFSGAWRKIVRNVPPNREARIHAFHTWFDAFRTLKLIHFCEERELGKYPAVPWNEAFENIVRIPPCSDQSALEYLEILRNAGQNESGNIRSTLI
jgi:hypothetical protein